MMILLMMLRTRQHIFQVGHRCESLGAGFHGVLPHVLLYRSAFIILNFLYHIYKRFGTELTTKCVGKLEDGGEILAAVQ